MFSVSSLQFEHLQYTSSCMKSTVTTVTVECLYLKPEGDSSLTAVLLRGELCGDTVNLKLEHLD